MTKLQIKHSDGKWKKLIKAMILRFFDHNVSRVGGQLAFFILLSLFPFLVFLNALIGSLNMSYDQLMTLLSPIFPEQIVELIIGYVRQVSQGQSIGLLSIAVVVVIFSASKAVRSLAFSVNTAYDIKENKHPVRNFFYSMLYVIAAGIVAVIIILFITLSEEFLLEIIKITHISEFVITLLGICRWAALVAILFFVLALMYKITPDKKVAFRHILPGTVLATLGMLFLTYGFSAYVNYFAKSSVLSGTIGAVILLMLWVYFASVIIILGAELNCAIEEISRKVE